MFLVTNENMGLCLYIYGRLRVSLILAEVGTPQPEGKMKGTLDRNETERKRMIEER